MTTYFHTPVASGESNSPSTINTRLSDLDSAIQSLDDTINAIVVENGTSDAELIAARTAIEYKSGTPPSTLSQAISYIAANQHHVDAYGAVGDGSTNDATALAAALAAMSAGDTLVFTPGKTYKCNSALTLSVANATIIGYGATLDTSALNGVALTVSAQNCKIVGLKFVGEATTGTVTAPASKNSIGITSSQNYLQVIDCRFEGYFKGGVRAQGDYVQIRGNTFVGVRNYDVDHYGAIHLGGAENCIVTNNVLLEVFDAGISIYQGARCTVANNIIRCTTESGGSGSMGIYANVNIALCTFANNVIYGAKNEGIMLGNNAASSESYGNTITGNTIEDCHYTGITIRAGSGGSGTESYNRYNSVTGNTIIITGVPGATQTDYGIFLDSAGTSSPVTDIAITGNTLMGTSDGGTKRLARGITPGGTGVARINISGNVINGAGSALFASGTDVLVMGNTVYGAGTALQTGSSTNGLIIGNRTIGSTTNSMLYNGTNVRTSATANFLDIKPTSAPNNWHRNYVASQSTTGSATLASGTVTITATIFGSTYSDAIVELERTSISGTAGALYVSNINQGADQITVRSTSASDNGTFVWRIVR